MKNDHEDEGPKRNPTMPMMFDDEDDLPLTHACLSGIPSKEYAWWANDARGIPLTKVCDKCEKEKLSVYRPEILSGYDQSDVDEPIEAEE